MFLMHTVYGACKRSCTDSMQEICADSAADAVSSRFETVCVVMRLQKLQYLTNLCFHAGT